MKIKLLILFALIACNFILFAASRPSDSITRWGINDCVSGGRGAISCSIGADVDFGGAGGGGNCSVSCGEGFYACCGFRCRCRSNSDPEGSGTEIRPVAP